MRCPTCGGENVEGAKFCGVCGQRLVEGPPTIPPGMQSPLASSPASQPPLPIARHATPVPSPAPRVTAETRTIPSKRGAPPPGASLGESLRVPEARGARMARIGIVLAIDAALAIAGIVLMTSGGDEASAAGGGAAGGADDGGVAIVAADGGTVAENPGGGGGGAGTALRPPGGGGGGGGGGGTGPGPGPGSVRDPGSVLPGGVVIDAATGGGPGTGGSGPMIDAGTVVTPPAIDAAATVEPPVIDAPPAAEPVDAPPAAEPIDAPGDPGVDAPEPAMSAGDLARHMARLVVQSAGRMDRCYQNATKALPPDQALSGEVDIGLSVMPTGQVQNVTVVRNTTGSSDLAACVKAGVESWSFPPHGEPEPVEFVNPFRFGPRPQ